MKKLDEWEAEAIEPLLRETTSLIQGNRILSERILTLISIVRKQQEALNEIERKINPATIFSGIAEQCREEVEEMLK